MPDNLAVFWVERIMSIEDDLFEQERWERCSTNYKRYHPAPCPELVSERTKLELLTTDDWIERMKEKDAMIDWLISKCERFCSERECEKCGVCSSHKIERWGEPWLPDWRKMAQEAVKKND